MICVVDLSNMYDEHMRLAKIIKQGTWFKITIDCLQNWLYTITELFF